MPGHPIPHRAKEKNGAAPALRRSLFARTVRLTLAIAMLSIGLLGSLSFIVSRSLITNQVLEQLGAVASQREDSIAHTQQLERERAANAAAALERQPDADTARALRSAFEAARQSDPSVTGITLIGPDRRMEAFQGEPSPLLFPQVGTTQLVPAIDRKSGWVADDVYARLNGGRVLAVRYDERPFIASLGRVESFGGRVRVQIGEERAGQLVVLQTTESGVLLRTYGIGTIDDPALENLALGRAVRGEEGERGGNDERGHAVFSAYRYLPSLGWGMSVDADAAEALLGVRQFGFWMGGIGLMLLLLSGVLGYMSARSLVHPLLELSRKMQVLRPGHWLFRRSVHTGDEVERLDQVVFDLAGRLSQTYEHLEEQVKDRTQELQKQYALDRVILETTSSGFLTVDAAGVVSDANPAALEALGFPKEELVGSVAMRSLVIASRHKQGDAAHHPLDRVLRTREPFRSHLSDHVSIIRKDQTGLPVALTIEPLVQGKTLLGALIMFQDMTEERQIDYMKSEFISLASHQLRTPLSSIRWYLEMLAEAKHLNAEEKSYIGEIDRAAERMANLLESLLHVAKLDGGGMQPEQKKILLQDVIRDMSAEWKVQCAERSITLHVALPSHPLHVSTDPVLIQIVLQNLFGNALKYAPDAKELWLSVTTADGKAEISLRDSGVGIPKPEQKRIFEKFFRAHNVRQMDTDGSGLGLYISRTIAERLGGTLGFASEEGKGTTFTLTIPLS
jgi:PAS domain S-box-containing protein